MPAEGAEFRNILFPVDFSDRCAAAAPYAAAMARLFGASVTLLHVIQRYTEQAFELTPFPETHWTAMRARAARALAEMAQRHFPDLTTTPVVAAGDAADEIVAVAEKRHIDLIMMPTHGTGRFRAALLGSVTAKTLSDAPCAVWTSAHPGESPAGARDGFHSVLCAIRPGPPSRSLLRFSAAFTGKTGAKLRLVHAVPGEECLLQREMNAEFEHYLKEAAASAIAKLQREAGTAFEVCVRAGTPSRVIAEVARNHTADLVLTGRGAEAHSIIRDSPCPVIGFQESC